jgi:hypothetical protein
MKNYSENKLAQPATDTEEYRIKPGRQYNVVKQSWVKEVSSVIAQSIQEIHRN